MRPLNSNNDYRSDWDPETKLAYMLEMTIILLIQLIF